MAIQAQMYSENLGFPLGCGGSQDLNDYGFGLKDFSLNLQEQQQMQPQHVQQYMQYVQLQQKNQKFFLQNNGNNNHNHLNNQSMVFSQSMIVQMEKQKQEIDAFITLQNERLRLGLMQQRNQQLQSILKKCESKAQIMLRHKDEEIAKAMNRTIELEDFLRRIESESQTWQRVALDYESMVVSLNNTIEQMKQQQQQSCYLSNNINGVEDAESCCETGENRVGGEFYQEDEAENLVQTTKGKMVCKNCNFGNSCMILMPCKHLCACKDCDEFLDSCPLCKVAKDYSIEVLF